MRYHLVSMLGSGGFGTVYKGVHLRTGRVFAVKIMVENDESWDRVVGLSYRGERMILERLNHPHIIRVFNSHGWGTSRVEIFMDLMDGTLESLAHALHPPCPLLAHHALRQMLQALDYLACHGYVHRDVKPENIFYTTTASSNDNGSGLSSSSSSPYHFRLGDFGLCDTESSANLPLNGTMLYMAPELFARPQRRQSHKSDVWALYVTMLWTLDLGGIRRMAVCGGGGGGGGASSAAEALSLALGVAAVGDSDGRVRVFRDMARVDPDERATAGEMLEMLFGGIRGGC
ncbi:kinase-like domain-containing protein [Chaetomidium leptoderma]|uniref:non-specific serine/threonine protein kinase n=1 Tax=Chaetomidium leptoderma TaxID=669021 RepID=A0AAN7A102_9PEZI|nr:kinase-like domain-containing protein [Chaetomidium leptoderma]